MFESCGSGCVSASAGAAETTKAATPISAARATRPSVMRAIAPPRLKTTRKCADRTTMRAPSQGRRRHLSPSDLARRGAGTRELVQPDRLDALRSFERLLERQTGLVKQPVSLPPGGIEPDCIGVDRPVRVDFGIGEALDGLAEHRDRHALHALEILGEQRPQPVSIDRPLEVDAPEADRGE